MKSLNFVFALVLIFSAFSFSANAQNKNKGKLKVGTLIDGRIQMTVTDARIKKFLFQQNQIKKVKLKDVMITSFPNDRQLYLVVSCEYNDRSVSLARAISIQGSDLLAAKTTTHTCTEKTCSGGCYHTKNSDGSLKGCGCNNWGGSCTHTITTTETEAINMEEITNF